jgi:LuxR family maltose regulon positive regulatory protein/serine/threonine-protein kinase PknK
VLEELEHRDMFLRPLDGDRVWFRYHHLFGSYLRRRLERDHPDRIVRLHRAASLWFADHGLLNEAVAHSLAAGDETRALDLVEQQAMSMVEHSRMATLLGLINKLPQFRLPGRPGLQIAVAWANCLLQRPQPAQTALHHVRAALAADGGHGDAKILGEVDVVQACIDVYGDRIDRAGDLVAPYVQEDPGHRPFVVAVSCNIHTFVDIQSFAYEMARKRQDRANAYHATTLGPFAGVYGRFRRQNVFMRTRCRWPGNPQASTRTRPGWQGHCSDGSGTNVGTSRRRRNCSGSVTNSVPRAASPTS